jgi:ankyrin repeat protein
LYELYPDSINLTAGNGSYPIHLAIANLKRRMNNPEAAIDMVQFLLDCNPDVVLQEYDGDLPLYWVCKEATNEITPTNLNVYLKILQILYDAYPGAIESESIATNLNSFPQTVQTFINKQLTYASQARDLRQMNTHDENGQLPLHRALLRDNVDLGSIKLLVKGNPSAIRCYDKRGTTPLHVACQHHESASVVQYLVDLDRTNLRARDFDDNTVLHYACRGAQYKTIALLLDRYGAVSVSKRNANNQLPIDLLLESNVVSDREGIEYTESIFRLLRAYPDTINCVCNKMPQIVTSNAKKRKVDGL